MCIRDRFGTATITLRVSDGQGTNSTSFLFTVNSVNDLPVISSLGNQVLNEDTPVTLSLTIGDVETPASALGLTASSTDPILTPASSFVFGGSGSNRTVTILSLIHI